MFERRYLCKEKTRLRTLRLHCSKAGRQASMRLCSMRIPYTGIRDLTEPEGHRLRCLQLAIRGRGASCLRCCRMFCNDGSGTGPGELSTGGGGTSCCCCCNLRCSSARCRGITSCRENWRGGMYCGCGGMNWTGWGTYPTPGAVNPNPSTRPFGKMAPEFWMPLYNGVGLGVQAAAP